MLLSRTVCEENYPDPKSGRDPQPDKPVCAKSCQEDVTNLTFSYTFLWFWSPIPRLLLSP